MFQGIRRKIHNLSIHMKLLLSYLLLCSICFLAFFSVFVPRITGMAEKNVLFSAEQALDQAEKYISFRMESIRQADYAFAYDPAVAQLISKDAADYTPQEQLRDQNTLRSRLSQVQLNYSQIIGSMELYLNDDFLYVSSYSSQYRPFSSIRNTPWYQAMQESRRSCYYIPPQWNTQPDCISVVNLISDPNDYSQHIGAVIIHTPEESIRSIIQKCVVTPGGCCCILNEKGVLITSSDPSKAVIDPEKARLALNQNGMYSDSRNLYCARKLDMCNWTLIQVISYRDITEIKHSNLSTLLLLCLGILGVIALLSVLISSTITRRLNFLKAQMAAFRYEKAIPIPVSREGDDIDQLFLSYNALMAEIQNLTQENIQKGQRLNQTELALLHTQINPHFLFNTLDMIRSLADQGKTQKVSGAIAALSAFYRRSLNKGSMLSTLENELQHVNAYLEIQRLRFGDRVRLEVDVPPDLLKVLLPRVALQPIVENALLHGILNDPEKSGTIRITAREFGHDVRVTVWDDGCGMSRQRLNRLFQPGSGVGLSNTNERLRLHFGSGYGLDVESVENQFTQVTIRVPAKEDPHEDSIG